MDFNENSGNQKKTAASAPSVASSFVRFGNLEQFEELQSINSGQSFSNLHIGNSAQVGQVPFRSLMNLPKSNGQQEITAEQLAQIRQEIRDEIEEQHERDKVIMAEQFEKEYQRKCAAQKQPPRAKSFSYEPLNEETNQDRACHSAGLFNDRGGFFDHEPEEADELSRLKNENFELGCELHRMSKQIIEQTNEIRKHIHERALTVLASKNLTRTKIKFAGRLLNYWHKTIPDPLDRTYKAHLHLHICDKTINFGASTSHTCFFLESCVGYIGARVTCPRAALKQMEQRLRLLPFEDELDELNELFSTKARSMVANKFQFSINLLPMELQDYLRKKHGSQMISCARSIKLEYFLIKSRVLVPNKKGYDSIIYVQSRDDGNIKPVLAELFYKVEKCDKIWILGRVMKIVKSLAKTFAWVKPEKARELLTDPKSFPDCFMVSKEIGELGNIDFQRVACKGLMVQYCDGNLEQRAVFPMGVFDHD